MGVGGVNKYRSSKYLAVIVLCILGTALPARRSSAENARRDITNNYLVSGMAEIRLGDRGKKRVNLLKPNKMPVIVSPQMLIRVNLFAQDQTGAGAECETEVGETTVFSCTPTVSYLTQTTDGRTIVVYKRSLSRGNVHSHGLVFEFSEELPRELPIGNNTLVLSVAKGGTTIFKFRIPIKVIDPRR